MGAGIRSESRQRVGHGNGADGRRAGPAWGMKGGPLPGQRDPSEGSRWRGSCLGGDAIEGTGCAGAGPRRALCPGVAGARRPGSGRMGPRRRRTATRRGENLTRDGPETGRPGWRDGGKRGHAGGLRGWVATRAYTRLQSGRTVWRRCVGGRTPDTDVFSRGFSLFGVCSVLGAMCSVWRPMCSVRKWRGKSAGVRGRGARAPTWPRRRAINARAGGERGGCRPRQALVGQVVAGRWTGAEGAAERRARRGGGQTNPRMLRQRRGAQSSGASGRGPATWARPAKRGPPGRLPERIRPGHHGLLYVAPITASQARGRRAARRRAS